MPAKNKILKIRSNIDKIDNKVLSLLNKRAELSLEIRNLKNETGDGLYDPKREEEIISKLCKMNEGPLYDENINDIFKNIMKINRELPDEK